MNGATPVLILAAPGVGFGHAVLPDHWVPLAVVGRTRRYPLARVARLSGLAGIAHVLVSLLIGVVIVAIGLQFRSTVEHAQDAIVGAVLLATGIAFIVLEVSGRRHGHSHGHDDGHGHDHGYHHEPRHGHRHRGRLGGAVAIMVPFGAAASPDLTILPVFLAAAAVGAGTAIGSLLAFAMVTIGTIVGLTLLATIGGYRVRGGWLERWANVVTAGALLTIGALVLTGTI
jgi:nickel/cobalt transporter (NicO) family protein